MAETVYLHFADGNGDPDDDPDHEPSDEEWWYDTEIAPRLREVGELCVDHNCGFIAKCEYEPGGTGSTRFWPEHSGAKLSLVALADLCEGNVDVLIDAIYRYAEKRGELGVSVYLQAIKAHKMER